MSPGGYASGGPREAAPVITFSRSLQDGPPSLELGHIWFRCRVKPARSRFQFSQPLAGIMKGARFLEAEFRGEAPEGIENPTR